MQAYICWLNARFADQVLCIWSYSQLVFFGALLDTNLSKTSYCRLLSPMYVY